MKQMLKKMALSGIANLFAEKMPFNKLIGMQVTHYDFDKVELRIKMDEKLIGNPFHNILHGGVTATLLDVAGGMIVAASCIDDLEEFSQLSQGALRSPRHHRSAGGLPAAGARQRVYRHRPHHPGWQQGGRRPDGAAQRRGHPHRLRHWYLSGGLNQVSA